MPTSCESNMLEEMRGFLGPASRERIIFAATNWGTARNPVGGDPSPVTEQLVSQLWVGLAQMFHSVVSFPLISLPASLDQSRHLLYMGPSSIIGRYPSATNFSNLTDTSGSCSVNSSDTDTDPDINTNIIDAGNIKNGSASGDAIVGQANFRSSANSDNINHVNITDTGNINNGTGSSDIVLRSSTNGNGGGNGNDNSGGNAYGGSAYGGNGSGNAYGGSAYGGNGGGETAAMRSPCETINPFTLK
ncbi:hypothetical protein GGX14DRAFT_400822 [Mycena pura]|uniref:Uncharacterized protein n=1 Tax=Mycena pura TaxID=153505 RepID=A0AAD6Y3Z2_9AGAR|nr:hypothetical protein GGX14DRAFT_400822 [Mycena pura]